MDALFTLDDREIGMYRQVSKLWYRLLSNQEQWRRRFFRTYPIADISSLFFKYYATHFKNWETLYHEYTERKLSDFNEWNDLIYDKDLVRTTAETMAFASHTYLNYGLAFQYYEQNPIIVEEEGNLVYSELAESYAAGVILNGLVALAVPLSCGHVFPKKPRYKFFVCQKFLELIESYLAAGFHLNTEEISPIYASLYNDMEKTLVNEDLRASYKAKALQLVANMKDNNRAKWYNFGCTYAVFGMHEEAEAHLRLAFNYCNGEHKEKWTKEGYFLKTDELIESSEVYDGDLDSVRDLPWFKALMEEAKALWKEEKAEAARLLAEQEDAVQERADL
eukprot:TRINITY_DN2496_c0_g1_i2.p1 TRINITY_DN2496_c0_g1~~TRINITY_DN2496_c0_g1_i2.p1  ORF type:complete len:389 (-),score=91.15 TRINITY_DN2496_c0_g1_i2:174-1178(-)